MIITYFTYAVMHLLQVVVSVHPPKILHFASILFSCLRNYKYNNECNLRVGMNMNVAYKVKEYYICLS